MNYWFNHAASILNEKIGTDIFVSNYDFIEEFINENRNEYFEDVDFEDIESEIEVNIEPFTKYVENNYPDLNLNPDGRWSKCDIKSESGILEEKVVLDEDEKKLLDKPIFELEGNLLQDFKKIYSKLLTMVDVDELKSQCSYKIALVGGKSKSLSDSELSDCWENAAKDAIGTKGANFIAECYKEAAFYSLKYFKYKESADYYEKASYFYEKNDKKIEMLKKARIQYQLIDQSDLASIAFVKEMHLKRKSSSPLSKLILSIYFVVSLYGESPWRTFITMAVVIIISSFFTFFYVLENPSGGWDDFLWTSTDIIIDRAVQSIYFSFVTFTTLGYGDVLPLTNLTKAFAGFLALVGLLNTSLFMITVVRKYSRS
jgi:hypothetical protein